MAFNAVHDYYAYRLSQQTEEESLYNAFKCNALDEDDYQIRLKLIAERNVISDSDRLRIIQSTYDRVKRSMQTELASLHEDFEFYRPFDTSSVPTEYQPAKGITLMPRLYHRGRTVTPTDSVPETGFPLHPIVSNLISTKYPEYLNIPTEYCRPLGSTLATFQDFNKPQTPVDPIDPNRKAEVIELVTHFLDARPFRPVHFMDTMFAKLPLNTGTGYHNRYNFKRRAHARVSHPEEYAFRPSSKGYYFNAMTEANRLLVHRMKYTGLPFKSDNELMNDSTIAIYSTQLDDWYAMFPTTLYTRNHISPRKGPLKQRPVYAVDDLFLSIEVMLTFPLLIQARKYSSCIMYGLETIRGSNIHLDQVAQQYGTYFNVDWTAFDQHMPRVITDTYYDTFLPSLLIYNHGYQPIVSHPTYPLMTPERMSKILTNLLRNLHLWFNNLTFISTCGYAYKRDYAGIPSGLFNTQYLDSYCNLFLLIDAFLEFGFTPREIKKFRLFIMGDDNACFSNESLTRMTEFIQFFEEYALSRYNMTLSSAKSRITTNRRFIETLSYQCNFGQPKRDLRKLVAQLCYPERGVKKQFMSYRALGIAYAACGTDSTFHDFCRDVYLSFLPFAQPPESIVKEKLFRYLPGQFNLLDETDFLVNLDAFPTIEEIQQFVSSWKGPLTYHPKWNYSHFLTDPDVVLRDGDVLSNSAQFKSAGVFTAPRL